MGCFTWNAKQSPIFAVIGLGFLSACTNTELAVGRNDAANPQAATAPMPALTRLSSSSDAQPATPPMPDEHTTHQHGLPAEKTDEASKHEATAAPEKAAHWTCTMHPEVDLPKPGKCPICGMKLVPKAVDTVDGRAK